MKRAHSIGSDYWLSQPPCRLLKRGFIPQVVLGRFGYLV
jgi:hypothetical protein